MNVGGIATQPRDDRHMRARPFRRQFDYLFDTIGRPVAHRDILATLQAQRKIDGALPLGVDGDRNMMAVAAGLNVDFSYATLRRVKRQAYFRRQVVSGETIPCQFRLDVDLGSDGLTCQAKGADDEYADRSPCPCHVVI